jgi:hypothetical protein
VKSWTREELNTYARWKHATDTSWRDGKIAYSKKCIKARYANDSEWRQARLQRENDKYADDPDWRRAKLQKSADRYANDPGYRQAELQRRKERYANNPAPRETETQKARERYANESEYRQSVLQRLAERWANNPNFEKPKRKGQKSDMPTTEKLFTCAGRSVTPMTPNFDRLSFSEEGSAMPTTLNTRPVKSNETRRDDYGRNSSLLLKVTSRTLRRYQQLKISRIDQGSNPEYDTLSDRAVALVRFPLLLATMFIVEVQ